MNILSYKLAAAIKQANPQETSSIEVMQYALNIILNSLLIVIISLLIGWFTGSLPDTAIALVSFAALRFFSGGRHLKTAAACNIFSITLCSSLPHISYLVQDHLWLINMSALILILVFAPNPDVNAQISLHWYPWMKLVSGLMILSNFFISSPVIGLAFFAQSLTVILLKKGGA
ncbi:putative regulator protein [compost metagenome]